MAAEGLQLGFSFMPYSAARALAAAEAAESAGFDVFGLPDSQVLWAGVYSTLGACAQRTSTLRIGPHVTNVVTRHWTVTAAEMRALEEVAPGRTFLGLGTGDGAVYGIGKKPAKATTLQGAIVQMKERMPDGVPVHLAAGGPRIAGVAGGTGSELILGTGADPGAIDELLVSARGEANGREVTPWLLMIFNLADGDGEEARVRAQSEVRASVIAYARHALATRLSSSGLEGPLKDELGAALERYDFMAHARPGDSPNARLGDAMSPELIAFLEERFAVIGTPEECAERLTAIAETTGVTRFWLACNVDDPAGALRHAGRMVARTSG